jgi:hypothetical protein
MDVFITAYASLAANLCAAARPGASSFSGRFGFSGRFVLARSCGIQPHQPDVQIPGLQLRPSGLHRRAALARLGAFVVPLICFGGLLVIAVLFFSDLEKQRRNSMPMLWLIFASILSILASFLGWPETSWRCWRWARRRSASCFFASPCSATACW